MCYNKYLVSLLVSFLIPLNSLNAGSQFTIVEDGQAVCSILVGCDADSPEHFAAKELQRYVKKISGAVLPIIGENEYTEGKAIFLGHNTVAKDLSIVMQQRYPEDDGYIFRFTNGSLFIVGACPRGTLFGVYAFLEKLGCRWFAPDFEHYNGNNEYVPEKKTLVIPQDNLIEKPDFRLRGAYIELFSTNNAPKDTRAIIEWMAKVRRNFIRINHHLVFDFHGTEPREILFQQGMWSAVLEANSARTLYLGVGGHGFYTWLSPNLYFDEHPEWFCAVSGKRSVSKSGNPRNPNMGQICSSNREGLTQFVKNYMTHVEDYTEVDIFVIIPNDYFQWCECQNCTNLGSDLNKYLAVVNHIARNIHITFPDKKIMSIGYQATSMPPDEKTVVFSKNIIHWITTIERDWRFPINYVPADYAFSHFPLVTPARLLPTPIRGYGYFWTMQQWLQKFHGMRVCAQDHYRKYLFTSLPNIKPHMIAKDFPIYKNIGITDIYMNYLEPNDWFSYEITHYAHALMSWNAGRNIEELLDDYCTIRYQETGPEMRRYFSVLEEGMNTYHMAGLFKFPVQSTWMIGKETDLNDLYYAKRTYKEAGKALEKAYRKVINSEERILIEKNRYCLKYVEMYNEANIYITTGEKKKAIRVLDDLIELLEQHHNDGIFVSGFRLFDLGIKWIIKMRDSLLE